MQKIVVLATGGSIAGMAASPDETRHYVSAQKGIGELLCNVPTPQGCEIEAHQLVQIDSKDMSFGVWRKLALAVEAALARTEVAGVVISHGTDTLEETAYFLHNIVSATKPVVLTAAMRPATALDADGPANLMNALSLAQWSGAHGVLCMMGGYILGAEDVRKQHTYKLNAFGAGEAGAVGVIEGGVLRQWRPWPCLAQPKLHAAQLPEDERLWPWVEVVNSMAGATGAVVDALVQQGVDGLVVVGTGSGTVHVALAERVNAALAAGVTVLRTTRVQDGAVWDAVEDTVNSAMRVAANTSAVKARVQLLLELLVLRQGQQSKEQSQEQSKKLSQKVRD